MPLFNFALRPLADIQPSRGRSGLALHWTDLSDGWFWLAVGGQELFRFEGEPTEGELPYLDEHVSRLWDALVAIAPAALAPVPEDIAPLLENRKGWEQLRERARALTDEPERIAAALGFWRERQLEVKAIEGAPELHLWRRGETLHASWTTPERGAGFTAVEGHASMPLVNFHLEAHAFDAAFLTLMGERLVALAEPGSTPDLPASVAIDLTRLTYDQDERTRALDAALARTPPVTDWAEVRWMIRRALPQ